MRPSLPSRPSLRVRSLPALALTWLSSGTLSLCALAVSGCTFTSYDIQRPLLVDNLLASNVAFFKCPPEAGRLTHLSWAYSQVHKYDDEGSYLNLGRDAVSLNLCPDNAFAWVLLGSDLAQLQQTDSANTATVEGINRLPRWGQSALPKYITQLRFVALLNLADYSIENGEYAAALDTLGEIDKPENLDAFRRLAFYFRAIEALIGLRDVAAAQDMLNRARGVTEAELGQISFSAQFNYPQYFATDRRMATLDYLEGQIALADGRAQDAVLKFNKAIAEYPELWEAHLALADALVVEGDLGTAITRYEALLLAKNNKMLGRVERVSFNLGNAYYAANRWEAAARSFATAAGIVRRRARHFRKNVAAILAESDHGALVRSVIDRGLDQEAEIFPEAYNNLGNCYIQLWLHERSEPYLSKAESAFKEALKSRYYGERYVAHANLGRVYWQQQRYDLYLGEMQLALMIAPSYRGAFDDLYQKSEALDPEQRIRAYNLIIDALGDSGPRKFISDHYGDWIGKISSFVETHPSLPLADRARAKILHLRGDDDAAMNIYAEAGAPDDVVWKAVGRALLERNSKTASSSQLEILLSSAIEEIEKEPGQGRYLLSDEKNAYLIRSSLRSAAGDKLSSNNDLAHALRVVPQGATTEALP